MVDFTIQAESKNKLAKNLENLYQWDKKRISSNYILFSNFEKIYFHYKNNLFLCNIVDKKSVFEKAKKLNILQI